MSEMQTALTRVVDGRLVPAVGTWRFEAGNSSVGFSVKHLMISKVRGTFREFSGTIEVTPDPLSSTVRAEIAAASIDTGMPFRDRDLKGPDFLDVERYPSLTFESAEVRPDGDDWNLAGALTIAGRTRPVELKMAFAGAAVDPWGHPKGMFSASTEIVREEWGLTYNKAVEGGGVLIGSKLTIDIEIQAKPELPA